MFVSSQKHLPYRDSKLTRLLQPYLSGNSHMAIVTTISPAAGKQEATSYARQRSCRQVRCPKP